MPGNFPEYLYASESDFRTYVSLYRSEYSDGHGYGYLQCHVDGTFFSCQLGYDQNLLAADGDAKGAVIHSRSRGIEYCWASWLPALVTFNCKASSYMESIGVSTYEATYFTAMNTKPTRDMLKPLSTA